MDQLRQGTRQCQGNVPRSRRIRKEAIGFGDDQFLGQLRNIPHSVKGVVVEDVNAISLIH